MSEKTADIIFFYAEWCTHCNKAILQWNKFISNFDKKIVEGYMVNCIVENCTDPMDPHTINTVEKYKIDFYPTIKLIKNDNDIEKGVSIIDYVSNSKITEDTLTIFLNGFLKESP